MFFCPRLKFPSKRNTKEKHKTYEKVTNAHDITHEKKKRNEVMSWKHENIKDL